MACTDCPRACTARGPRSYCGLDRPGRVYWQGVTLLEEHELAPTYEVWLTGCSLRCRFCTVPAAIESPRDAPWHAPDDVLDRALAADTPPFRSLALVGGDPTVSRPWVDAFLPRARARLPGIDLVLNTNMYLSGPQAAADARAFDWIVGDLHFWTADCARRLAGASDYPDVARAAAEAVADAGGRLILRLLLLPGHAACCGRPAIAWAAELARRSEGRVLVHVMAHYAPAGRAQGHPELGRMLDADERALVALLPDDVPRPRSTPLADRPARPATARDPAAPLRFHADGSVLLPFVTGDLLPLAVELDPTLAPRLAYLDPD
ncbi:MAG: radical SAM protein [Alphaproteobacteria bacterium]|nr:radical SAM protein [Alphaproteobacteria bacterium]